jgi:hypothetical protein
MSTVTTMRSNTISSLLVASAIVIVVPLAMWIEHTENPTWTNRLALPSFKDEENRHTPLLTQGTFLPPTIPDTLTLTPAQNPVILTTVTHIPANSSLIIKPGVHIYAHEYAAIVVAGSLTMQGTATEPVTITTNEKHPSNQVWAGIITLSGGRTSIDQAHIAFASPAITCTAKSIVAITNSRLEDGNTGIFNASDNCRNDHITFKRIHDTIIHSN